MEINLRPDLPECTRSIRRAVMMMMINGFLHRSLQIDLDDLLVRVCVLLDRANNDAFVLGACCLHHHCRGTFDYRRVFVVVVVVVVIVDEDFGRRPVVARP